MLVFPMIVYSKASRRCIASKVPARILTNLGAGLRKLFLAVLPFALSS